MWAVVQPGWDPWQPSPHPGPFVHPTEEVKELRSAQRWQGRQRRWRIGPLASFHPDFSVSGCEKSLRPSRGPSAPLPFLLFFSPLLSLLCSLWLGPRKPLRQALCACQVRPLPTAAPFSRARPIDMESFSQRRKMLSKYKTGLPGRLSVRRGEYPSCSRTTSRMRSDQAFRVRPSGWALLPPHNQLPESRSSSAPRHSGRGVTESTTLSLSSAAPCSSPLLPCMFCICIPCFDSNSLPLPPAPFSLWHVCLCVQHQTPQNPPVLLPREAVFFVTKPDSPCQVEIAGE